MDATDKKTTTSSPLSGALAQVLPELMQIPVAALRSINLDIPSAVVTVMGVLPELRAQRAAIVAVLGEQHAEPIDKIEVYGQAALQADADHTISITPAPVAALSAEVVETIEVLRADAVAHVKRKHIEPGALAELRGGVGFSNQVFDLVQLIAVFRKYWATLAPVTRVTLAELDAAEQLAKRFVDALGEREQGPAATSASADLQKRAYTKFVDTYDLIRRAIAFLRWTQGDADTIAPSLWAGRGGRKTRSQDGGGVPAADDGEPSTPVAPSPINGGGPFTP